MRHSPQIAFHVIPTSRALARHMLRKTEEAMVAWKRELASSRSFVSWERSPRALCMFQFSKWRQLRWSTFCRTLRKRNQHKHRKAFLDAKDHERCWIFCNIQQQYSRHKRKRKRKISGFFSSGASDKSHWLTIKCENYWYWRYRNSFIK